MRLSKPAWLDQGEGYPIFSIDIHPDNTRVVTGGQGNESEGTVAIWNLTPILSKDENASDPKLLCQLNYHNACVNCVRWSNSGNYLCSGGDDKVIIVWNLVSKYSGENTSSSALNNAFGQPNLEQWKSIAMLRRHNGDVLDLAWSPSDAYLASASVDNSVVIWDAHNFPQITTIITGHHGLVKGVSWDPVGKYLATQSDDKTLKIWTVGTWKLEQSVEAPFQQCGATTHVLRLDWATNGTQLVSAHAMNNGGPTARVIERSTWTAHKDIVGHRKAIGCVRFGRSLMRKGDNFKEYLTFLALGSRDTSVSVWSTGLKRPLVVIHDLFTSSVVDISWSSCGTVMMACSLDGSVAVAQFSKEEVGQPLTQEERAAVFKELYGINGSHIGMGDEELIQNLEVLHTRDKLGMDKEVVGDWTKSVERHTEVVVKGPTDTQIEAITAGGKRRITPMFLVPSIKPEDHNLISCSSSKREKVVSDVQANAEEDKYRKAINLWRGCFGVTTKPKGIEITPAKHPSKVVPAPSASDPCSKGGSLCASVITPDSGKEITSISKNPIKNSISLKKPVVILKQMDSKQVESIFAKQGYTGRLTRNMKRQVEIQQQAKSSHSDTSTNDPEDNQDSSDSERLSKSSNISSDEENIIPSPTNRCPPKSMIQASNLKSDIPPTPYQPRCFIPSRPHAKSLHRSVVTSPLQTEDPTTAASGIGPFLPKMKSDRVLKLHVDLHQDSKSSYSLQATNHHQRSDGMCHQLTCLHSNSSLNSLDWTVCTDAPICGLAGDLFRIVAVCENATIHVLDLKGRYVMPPILLMGYPSKMILCGAFLSVITSNAFIGVWNIHTKCTVLKPDSLEAMLTQDDSLTENKAQPCDVDIIRIDLNAEGTPEITLSTGKVFLWSKELATWFLTSDAGGLVSSIASKHRFLSRIRLSWGAPEMAVISNIKLKLAISFEKKKPDEVLMWTVALAKELARNDLEKELRCLLEDLLGPFHSSARFSKSWEPTIMGVVDKRTLLRRILNLLVEDLGNQEIFAEFDEKLRDLETFND